MPGEVTRKQFTKAYDHLLKGELEEAATCFQHIIDNPDQYEFGAPRIAKQKLFWYCVPLEIIIKKMGESRNPVNITPLLSELIETNDEYITVEIQHLLDAVETELEKNPYCVNIGTHIWINREYLENQVQELLTYSNRYANPIILNEYIRKIWNEFCSKNSNFPDSTTLNSLSELLSEYNSRVIEKTILLPEDFHIKFFKAFKEKILNFKQPISLTDFLSVFVGSAISNEHLPIINKHLNLYLDKDLTNYNQDYYILMTLVVMDGINFDGDGLFNNNQNPLSSIDLIKEIVNCKEDINPSNKFVSDVKKLFKANSKLTAHQDDFWFSKIVINQHITKIMKILEGNESLFSLEIAISKAIGWGDEIEAFKKYQELLKNELLEEKLLVQVTDSQWIGIDKTKSIIQDMYKYFLQAGTNNIKTTIVEILSNRTTQPILVSFIDFLDKQLRNDPRFEIIKETEDIWWNAIEPWKKAHKPIIDHLTNTHALITLEDIQNLPGISKNEIDITRDDRLKKFPNEYWGLSNWVWINDLVYDYLLRTHQKLHEIVVIHRICEEEKLTEKDVIFTPKTDHRFAQDNLNRWFCKHLLTNVEVDRVLAKLEKYGGIGRYLNQLTNEILHLECSETNAEEVFENDSRFFRIDELWFNKITAYRIFGQDEIEKLFDKLSELPAETIAISITDMGKEYLNCDGRLTNLSELLKEDGRFLEVYEGYWSLKSWSSPNLARDLRGHNVAVRTKTDSTTPSEKEIEEPPDLTKREGKTGSEADQEKTSHKKVYITLKLLDILNGNIRISGLVRTWITDGEPSVKIMCPDGMESIGILNEDRTILAIRDLIQKRRLTYGDKISFQPGKSFGTLLIDHYGRDERTYQEAVKHKNIEKLIEEARNANKSYHDLIIEVMEEMAIPLTRDDIYQLVDYQRTATINTISAILSLPDCPYNELRYFVSVDDSKWIFDRNRKVAFDMKMKELEEENALLKKDLDNLKQSSKATEEKDSEINELNKKIGKLEERTKKYKEEIEDKKETVNLDLIEKGKQQFINHQLEEKIKALEQEKSNRELAIKQTKQIIDSLQVEVIVLRKGTKTEKEMADISKKLQESAERISNLLQENSDLERENRHKTTTVEKLSVELTFLQENQKKNLDIIDQLKGEIEKKNNQIDLKLKRTFEEREEIEKKAEILSVEKAILEKEIATINENTKILENDNSNLRTEMNKFVTQVRDGETNLETIKSRLERIEKALSTPFGRLFARIKKLS